MYGGSTLLARFKLIWENFYLGSCILCRQMDGSHQIPMFQRDKHCQILEPLYHRKIAYSKGNY